MGISTSLFSQTEEGAALDPALTRGHSLGVVRASHVESVYNMVPLLQAARRKPVDIFNPNGSTGCSPILRLLLVQTGLAHSVVNEVALDGQVYGHHGGNAIDIGPGSPEHLLTDLRSTASVLRSFAPLFSCVCYQDSRDETRSLYIWDGAVVNTPLDMTGMSTSATEFAAACRSDIHVASSFGRIANVLSTNSSIRHIFTALPTNNTSGSDRSVYVEVQDFSTNVFISGQKNNTRW